MPTLQIEELVTHCQRLLEAVGVPDEEARRVANSLVVANTMGHDSHGVVRIPHYVNAVREGTFQPGKQIRIVREADASAVVDGQWGFGQSICHQAMQLAMDKARQRSVAVVEVRNCSHIGRLGEYVELAAAHQMIGIVACNNHGGGILQAPFGGIDARMSPNPLAVGVPTGGEFPIVVDMTASVVAEGKIRMKRNLGEPLPAGWALDADGNPITEPEQFYGPPRGAILPFGGASAHKGFALSIVVEVLAGALGGGGYSRERAERSGNGVFVMAIDLAAFTAVEEFHGQTQEFITWLKSSRLMAGFEEITVPGELEHRRRLQKRTDGVLVDDETWRQLMDTATTVGITLNTTEE